MNNIKRNYPLKKYNSLLMNHKAQYFCEVHSKEESYEFIDFSIRKKLPLKILGTVFVVLYFSTNTWNSSLVRRFGIEISSNARKLIEDNYNKDKIIKQWHEIIDSIII